MHVSDNYTLFGASLSTFMRIKKRVLQLWKPEKIGRRLFLQLTVKTMKNVREFQFISRFNGFCSLRSFKLCFSLNHWAMEWREVTLNVIYKYFVDSINYFIFTYSVIRKRLTLFIIIYSLVECSRSRHIKHTRINILILILNYYFVIRIKILYAMLLILWSYKILIFEN